MSGRVMLAWWEALEGVAPVRAGDAPVGAGEVPVPTSEAASERAGVTALAAVRVARLLHRARRDIDMIWPAGVYFIRVFMKKVTSAATRSGCLS